MSKGRFEAFSDGVMAIIVTIMVLELKVPHGADLAALRPLLPVFISYVMSFAFIIIYWNNHHHLMHAAKSVNGAALWANAHLLFWLSLIPFSTAWMGENHFPPLPVAVYGVVLLFSGMAYYILSQVLIAHHGKQSTLAVAVGTDVKGIISVAAYLIAIPFAFINSLVAYCLYAAVAIMWFIPDRRLEKIANS